jgi:tRNA threonylcarbamoyladenosine biosynthesis protein TsaB
MTSILALDAAGAACSAALWRDGRVVASRFEPMRRGHAERLVPMIDAVMADGAAAYAELDRLAVTLGPGGFTGVRIGLATARGLALATGRPLVGVSNFLVLAAAATAEVPPDGSLVVAIDAKRRDFYLQVFAADLRPCAEPCAILPAAGGSWSAPARRRPRPPWRPRSANSACPGRPPWSTPRGSPNWSPPRTLTSPRTAPSRRFTCARRT